jgi:lycopene cyclase domain-containing protein
VKEYTTLAALSAVIAVVLDLVILRTKLIRTGRFWLFIAIMYGFKLLMNGYLTSRPIVLYNADHFMGSRLGTIPYEDFLYAFALVSVPVIVWEWWGRRVGKQS